jgi:hypothetical protein
MEQVKAYFCAPCNQTFQYKVAKSFRHHQLFHHSTLRGFKCPFCKMEYVSRYPKSLLLHLASSHKVNEKMGSLQAFILKFGITDNPDGAGNIAVSREHLQTMAHYFVDQPQNATGSSNPTQQAVAKTPPLTQGNNFNGAAKSSAYDSETQYLLSGFGGLIKMTNPEDKGSPYLCPQCTHQEFANYPDLLHHTAYCHSNIKGFKCDFCPKRVTFPQTLQVHLAGTHGVRHKFEGLLQFIKKYGVFRDEKPSLQNLCPPLAPQAPQPPPTKASVQQAKAPLPNPAPKTAEKPKTSTQNSTPPSPSFRGFRDVPSAPQRRIDTDTAVQQPPIVDYRCTFCSFTSLEAQPVRIHLKNQHIAQLCK